MFTSIWADIKREFQFGNMITRIVIVNIVVFLIVNVIMIGFYVFNRGFVPPMFDTFLHRFCIGASWEHNLYHPWVFFTNMFLHQGFFHLAFNMLYLYWFGQIVGDLIGNNRILPIYILGGLAGALMFFLSANYFSNIGQFALGASAAVMAIAMTAGVMAPDYILRLVIFGEIKLKYIVGVLFLLDLIGTTASVNSGGHLAHIGGALMGYIYAKRLRAGQDLAAPINSVIDFVMNWKDLFKAKPKKSYRPKPEMAYKNKEKKQRTDDYQSESKSSFSANDPDNQAHLDSILDKIKQSGYDSLNQEEKEFLFKMSR
jgi:membrane associated rhomboid family serine protease